MISRAIKTLMVGFALLASGYTVASEQEDVCLKYWKEPGGWSEGYAMKATVISGTDLNSAAGGLPQFNALSTYAVVFWNKEQASIFELPVMAMGDIPILETEIEDQQGRTWQIKRGNIVCN